MALNKNEEKQNYYFAHLCGIKKTSKEVTALIDAKTFTCTNK